MQPFVLGNDLGERGPEASQPLVLLRHDGGRGAGDEAFRRQLLFGLDDLAFDARDFLAEAILLGGDVDLDRKSVV